MRNILTVILMLSCFMVAHLSYAMPGSPCSRADGSMCYSGTRGCNCAHHPQHPQPVGQYCIGMNGKPCYGGTLGCVCKHQTHKVGTPCARADGTLCYSGTRGCVCAHR